MLDLFNVLNICQNVIGDNGVPSEIASMVHYIYLAIKVVIPILLIIFGMIELGKAVTAQKEDEIKKAQGSFIKKLILAVIVFLAFSIVEFVVQFAGGNAEDNSNDGNVWKCTCELLKGEGAKSCKSK